MERFDFPRRLDPTQPYGPPSSERHDETRDVFGDSGPWTWLLAEAWQQAAAPEIFVGPNRRPAVPYEGTDGQMDTVAYWAPLVSLMHHGLGWRRPDLGLWRWRHEGKSFDDPILTTLDRRYGTDLDLMMSWLVIEGWYVKYGNRGQQDSSNTPLELKRYSESVRSSEAYQAAFGPDPDSHHLGFHVEMVQDSAAVTFVPAAGAGFDNQAVDQVLIAKRFHDAFTSLTNGEVSEQTQNRSTRVAVVWPPGGWLGTYRCSGKTGLWFRGRHAVHELGNQT